jgi:hypothetical protein
MLPPLVDLFKVNLLQWLKGPDVVALIAPIGPALGKTPAGRNEDAVLVLANGPLLRSYGELNFGVRPGSPGRDPPTNDFGFLLCQPVRLLGRHFVAFP